MSPELGVPAVNRTDVIELDFSAQIFLKPFEQEPTAAEHLPAKRRRAAYGDTVGPGGSPMSPRMQPRNDKFFTLCSNSASRY